MRSDIGKFAKRRSLRLQPIETETKASDRQGSTHGGVEGRLAEDATIPVSPIENHEECVDCSVLILPSPESERTESEIRAITGDEHGAVEENIRLVDDEDGQAPEASPAKSSDYSCFTSLEVPGVANVTLDQSVRLTAETTLPKNIGQQAGEIEVGEFNVVDEDTEELHLTPQTATREEHDVQVPVASNETLNITPMKKTSEPEESDDVHEATEEDQINSIIAQSRDEANDIGTTISKDQSPQKEQDTNAPARRTRSGIRFSDDTSMLKDFLHRAQARKAAQSSKNDENVESLARLPRRSPRKILGQLDNNSPSPRKRQSPAHRPGTPPSKSNPLTNEGGHDIDEADVAPTSCRRSARKRLPAVAKTIPGTASFIPVRRPDGADPVVLPRSDAQEIATVTRANTRRNKGQAKPPKTILPTLLTTTEATDTTADVTTHESRAAGAGAGAKAVGWNDELVQYFEERSTGMDEEGVDEKRQKIRRIRSLGPRTNGTPAANRMTAMDVGPASGTPMPKRRGKPR